MRNVIRRLMGKPVQLSPKQEEKMARIRAKSEADVAKREAEARAAMAEAAKYMPGGVHYGGTAANVGPAGGADATGVAAASTDPQLAQVPMTASGRPDVKAMFKQSFEAAKDTFGEMFDDRRDVLDPGPDADLNRPPALIEDPVERERVAGAERSARDAARAPYRAPDSPAFTITRFATTGSRQLEDVAAHVRASGLAAHPELVFGLYRVPERFDHGKNNEKNAYIEWEVVHRPIERPIAAPDTDVGSVGFPREGRWIQRKKGEPSVLDEDVAGTFCARALLRPEDCFGLTRFLHVRGKDSESEGTSWYSEIQGALVFARGTDNMLRTREAMMAEAPLALAAPRPPLPFHLEILDWEAVAAWNSPSRWSPARVPAPLPHLPTTPHELIAAYLEIVGVRSEDSYSVQIARTSANFIADLSLASSRLNFRGPPKLPCVDGKERSRMYTAEHVVIAYRDRAEYQEGRERWRAYQRDVLRAKLDHLSAERPPIEVNDRPRQSFLSELFDFVNPLDPWQMPPQIFGRGDKPSLGPYCGELLEYDRSK